MVGTPTVGIPVSDKLIFVTSPVAGADSAGFVDCVSPPDGSGSIVSGAGLRPVKARKTSSNRDGSVAGIGRADRSPYFRFLFELIWPLQHGSVIPMCVH
jgi:hypothetical protein